MMTSHWMSKTTSKFSKANRWTRWIVAATSRSHVHAFEAKGQMQHLPKIDDVFNDWTRIDVCTAFHFHDLCFRYLTIVYQTTIGNLCENAVTLRGKPNVFTKWAEINVFTTRATINLDSPWNFDGTLCRHLIFDLLYIDWECVRKSYTFMQVLDVFITRAWREWQINFCPTVNFHASVWNAWCL